MSGPTVARCPHCSYPYTTADGRVGSEIHCKTCGNSFTLTSNGNGVGIGNGIGPRPKVAGEKTRVVSISRAAQTRSASTAARPLTLPLPLTASASATAAAAAAAASDTSAWEIPETEEEPEEEVAPRPSTGHGPMIATLIVAFVVFVALVIGSLMLINRPPSASAPDDADADIDLAPRIPTGPPPALAFHDDASGNRVGTVTVRGRRSASTDLKLVLPAGQHADHSVPCVFICPAGSNLLVGVPFGPNEQDDLDPLLSRGLAVCFYSLDGTVDDLQTTNERRLLSAMTQYRRSDAGMHNLSDAIDTVLANAPQVDPARLATCGHSSAGTVALMAAAREPRIRAVAAMAPATDLPKRLASVTSGDDRMSAYVRRISPSEVASFPCPIWIYHASDDENVPVSDSKAFAEKHRGHVTLRIANTGGHVGAYTQGLPEAAHFLAATLKAQ